MQGAVRRTHDEGSLRELRCCGVRNPGGWHAFLWHVVFIHKIADPRVESGKQFFLSDFTSLTEPPSTVTSHCLVPCLPGFSVPCQLKALFHVFPACRPHPTLTFLLPSGLAGLCCAHSKSLGCSSVIWCLVHRDNMSSVCFQLSS